MVPLVLEVKWNPSAIDKDCLFFALCAQVSVEGRHNVVTFLSIAILLNLDLTRVVEDATYCNWLHGPVAFELVEVVF